MLQKRERHLKEECPVSIARIIVARLVVLFMVINTSHSYYSWNREDLTTIQTASRGVVRQKTQSSINKVYHDHI